MTRQVISIKPVKAPMFAELSRFPIEFAGTVSAESWGYPQNHQFFQWEFQDPKMEVLYHIRPLIFEEDFPL